MEQLKTFLARTLPWPEEGEHYVNVHWLQWSDNAQRSFWSGRAVRSVDEAARTIRWAQGLPDTRDIYICMSAQKEAEPKVSGKGHHYFLPIRNKQNAIALKDLYLDIDVKGGDKGYDDLRAAGAALAEFVQAIDIPRPTMLIGSGGGMHAHWELDRALPPAEWQVLANALAEATRQHGLKCDTQVTVDSARILRPPETMNWKNNQQKPTRILGRVTEGSYSVERIARALEPYKVAAKNPNTQNGFDLGGLGESAPSSKFGQIENDISAGITGPAPDLAVLAEDCPFLAQALETGGAEFAQPLWNLTTLIATFSEGGRDDAHRMAMGHPDYSEESTDALFDRKVREREERDLGWPSCRSIMNAGCQSCRTCPRLVEGKSPLKAVTTVAAVEEAVDDDKVPLPPKFIMNKDGSICFLLEDDMGGKKLVPVIKYPISDAWLQEDPWIIHFTAVTHSDKRKKVEIPFGQATATDTVTKALAERGIMIDPGNAKLVRDFFMSWVQVLQKRKNAVIESAPYGWNTNNGEVDGFCFGGEVWTPDGSRPAPEMDRVLRGQYQPTGSAEPWHKASKLVIGVGRPELEVVVASAFAGPIVKATGWYGAFISAYSQESGIGKTTAMKIAQSVWGNPVTAMQGLDDTLNSVSHKIGQIRSLPLYWDEIKGEDSTKKFVKLAFQLTSGKDKSRMGRDASLREVGQWQTMLVSATNESLLDHVAVHSGQTTAGLYRLFEFEVAPKKKLADDADTGDAQRMLGKLDDNYGMVGLEYAKWLGANYKRVDQEVGEYMKTLEKQWGFQQDERFWLCGITCIVMGARYASEIGICHFDIAGMEAFLKRTLGRMREHLRETHIDLTNPTNVMNLFTQFLKAMHRHTLWTNRIPKGAGRPKPGEFKIIRDATRVDGLHVHIGKEDKLIRVSSAALSEWCGSRGVSRHIFIRELKKSFGATDRVARLGSGTDRVENTEHLIEFLAAGTSLATFIDETTEDDNAEEK